MQNNKPADDKVEEKYGKNGKSFSISQINRIGGEKSRARENWPAAADHGQSDAKEERHDRARTSEIEEYVVEIGDHDERQKTVAENANALKEADLARE